MDDRQLSLFMERRSVREFADAPVEENKIQALLEATRRAPTAGNMMLYSILRIEDRALKERLAITCDDQPFIARAPLVLVFLADYAKWERYFDHCGVDAMCEAAGGKRIRPGAGDMLLAIDDALIAAQTAASAAEALGLGSCYIGDVMERFEEHRSLLGFPRWCFPAAMLCIGYPKPQASIRSAVPRFPLDTFVFTDKYRELGPDDYERMFGIPEYRRVALKPGAENYGQHMYIRKFSAAFSEEMRRSVDVAIDEWRSSSF